MHRSGFDLTISEVSSLHGMVHVEGWARHPADFIAEVRPSGTGLTRLDEEVQVPDGGIVSAEHALRFRCRFVVPRSSDRLAASLHFRSRHRQRFSIDLRELVDEARRDSPVDELREEFIQGLAGSMSARVLDIGGRDRSDGGYRAGLGQHETVVLDLYPGPEVDVVGDAHRLSDHFPADHFDAIASTATFEHLFMPWKVVLEMSKVLRPGGLVFVLTHQSIGMHDEPNDFWRYTRDCWPALFNEATGFEVVRSAMAQPMLLLPRLDAGDAVAYEDAVGYYASAVLARRTGEPRVDWPVDPPGALRRSYPTG